MCGNPTVPAIKHSVSAMNCHGVPTQSRFVTSSGGVMPSPCRLVRQEALPFGIAAWRLGAGRARKEDPVQHAAGIDLHAKPGDAVRKGEPLFTLHADEPARFARALDAVEGAWTIGDAGDPVEDGGPLIADRIGR